MIDGLKLTFSGEEIRTLLEDAMRRHEAAAQRWTRETLRTTEDETDDAPLLPHHICENEGERHSWRVAVLAFLHAHLEPRETYRLDAADLQYGELLPEKPGWMEQDEHEARTRVGFNLERLVKSIDGLGGLASLIQSRLESACADSRAAAKTGENETGEYRTTRIDIEDGPEIIKIERI